MRKRSKAVIFGIGNGGMRAFAAYRKALRIIAFSDNNVSRHGDYFIGRKIVSPSGLPDIDFDVVLIASSYHEEIVPQLRELGIYRSRIQVVPSAILAGMQMEIVLSRGIRRNRWYY